jgi:hypothetical protein
MSRKPSSCSVCNAVGHTKSSKECPMYIPFWNKETEEKLIQIIDEYTDINWEEVSEKMGLSISNCKNKYTELCPLDKKLKNKLTKLTDDFIYNLLEENKKFCEVCNKFQYNYLSTWKGKKECDECYQHDSEIKETWRQVNKFCIENKITHCAFCNKEKTFKTSFNYDHNNMFDKLECVGTLIYRGEEIDIILNEVQKCQLLCVSCHAVVTKIEQRLGFTSIKINMNKEYSDEELEIKKKEYSDLYSKHMYPIYEKIRNKIDKKE